MAEIKDCELCGKKIESSFHEIENIVNGTVLIICSDCLKWFTKQKEEAKNDYQNNSKH